MKLQTMAFTKKYGFRFNFSKTYWLPLEVFQKKKSNTFNPFTFQWIASKIFFQVFPDILINFLFFFKICKWPIFQWQLLIKVSMFSKNKPSHCFQGLFFRVSFFFRNQQLGTGFSPIQTFLLKTKAQVLLLRPSWFSKGFSLFDTYKS